MNTIRVILCLVLGALSGSAWAVTAGDWVMQQRAASGNGYDLRTVAPGTLGGVKFFGQDATGNLVLQAGTGLGDALVSAPLSQFAATTSAQFAGVISDETGTGAVVLANSPTLVTPVLGAATATTINLLTITSSTGTLTITNLKTLSVSNTLTLAGTDGSTLNIGTGGTLGTSAYVTLGANVGTWMATPSSANLLAALSDETGTGVAVFNNSPTLVTPVLGVATATSVNGLTITTTTGTLTIASAKVATFSNTITLAGTDGSTLNIGTGGTLGTSAYVTLGTGVGTALAVNVGTAGAFVVNGGALGTPSSGNLSNCSNPPLPRGFLSGLNLANNAGDATNDIDVSPGVARGALDLANLSLSTTFTKQLDAAWAAGSAAGGLDQGSIANATYFVHIIGDGASTNDVIFSLSHDESATVTMTIASPCVVTWGSTNKGHGLVAGSPFKFSTTGALPTGVTAGTQYYVISAGLSETTFEFSATNGGSAVNTSGTQSGVHTGLAGPKLPNGYTYYRCLGSIVRISAAIQPFTQDGDDFSIVTPIMDVNVTNLSTARTTYTLASIPTGRRIKARVRAVTSNGTAGTMTTLGDLSVTDAAPSFTASPGTTFFIQTAASADAKELEIMTNAAAQICARASAASTTLRVWPLGWRDRRGRDR